MAQALESRGGEWTERVDDEETRSFYQERLCLFAKMMMIIDAMFFATALAAYRMYPSMRPLHMNALHIIGGLGMLLLLVMWRVLLRSEKKTLRQLLALDAIIVIGIGLIFGVLCFFSYDHEVNMWSMFIWTVFMIFGRVLYVPSTARRTAALSGVAVGCIAVAGAVVAIWKPQGLSVPGPVWALGATMYGAVAVLIATVGSKVIYGLRSQVRAAQKLGQYTLGRKIGEGGMGAVYEAHHSLLRRPTAIKLLPPENSGAETRERFELEVQITAELNHPNTVEIYDYGRSRDGLFYYAMEYLDGLDLETLVSVHGPQSAPRVVHILLQISGALAEAHARGLIHRDVKPANIFLCELGGVPDVAKILDFGLVKDFENKSHASAANTVAGTPAYISPEAVTKPETVGAPADLYGLGGVAYFLLTGTPLFSASTSIEMCVHHVRTDPTPMAERTDNPISEALAAVVMRLLEKEARHRPQSATELRRLLRDVPESARWDEDRALLWWREEGHAIPSDAAHRTDRPHEMSLTIERFAAGSDRTAESWSL